MTQHFTKTAKIVYIHILGTMLVVLLQNLIFISINEIHGFDAYKVFDNTSPQIGFGVLRIIFDSSFIGNEIYNINDFEAVSFSPCHCKSPFLPPPKLACQVQTLDDFNKCDGSAAISCDTRHKLDQKVVHLVSYYQMQMLVTMD